CFFFWSGAHRDLPSFPTRRSSDLWWGDTDCAIVGGPSPTALPRGGCLPLPQAGEGLKQSSCEVQPLYRDSGRGRDPSPWRWEGRSEEHTSELQSRGHLVCRLLLEK